MNKSEAMKWLIKNVTRWPAQKGGIVSAPKGWQWGWFNDGEIKLVKSMPTEMYADCHVDQREWLNPVCVECDDPKTYESEKIRADALQDVINSIDVLHYDECEKLRAEIALLKQQLRMKKVN